MHTIKRYRFRDREDAGRNLANRLSKYAGVRDVVILALPMGGVPVAAEIGRILGKPFDILLVGKINAPGHDGTSLGAITGGGVRMLNSEMIDRLHLSESDINMVVLKESLEIARKERLYRGHRPSLEVADKIVILVDDGTSPCSSVRDAIRLLRRQHAEQVVVAMPTSRRNTACDLRMEADDVVILAEPKAAAPDKWFEKFPQLSDDDVCQLLTEISPETAASHRQSHFDGLSASCA